MAKSTKTQTYAVTANSLNIREKPYKKAKTVKGSPVIKDTELTVYPGTEVTADDYDWIKVNFKGQKCWAAKQYLTQKIEEDKENENTENMD
jgi:IS1 family transposase